MNRIQLINVVSRLRLIILCAAIVIITGLWKSSYCQISSGGTPFSFATNRVSNETPTVIMEEIDVKALFEEDKSDNEKGKPYRFGIDLDVDLELANSGKWETLSNGAKLWRLNIQSQGAYSINLIFSKYKLPDGASLFIYSIDQAHVIGAFTSHNNKLHGKFSTTVVKGSSIVLEYYEPANVEFQGELVISKVIHAYRNAFFSNTKMGFGDSGACNNNVNCPVGLGWENQINASLLYTLSNNTRICSGSILNNVKEDGTPYFLSAEHCFSSDYATWIFMFNYQSPNCTNIDGPTNETVSGCTLKAKRGDSDFMLFEISSPPPPQYNVYYSGWSNADTPATSAVGIHHPASDIKKISFDTNAVFSDAWGSTPNTHWRVDDWDDGTTEGGSSGSPLFDQNHRVVGQLTGGGAACGNDLEDMYGKVAHSWDGSSSMERLKDWLDPDNTDTTTIDGASFTTPAFAVDALMSSISSISSYSCDSMVEPEILIRNMGSDTLISLDIYYGLSGGGLSMVPWTGNLGYTQSAILTLPSITLPSGIYTYLTVVDNPNGSVDQNPVNDSASYDFTIIDGRIVTIELLTDDYAYETSFEIQDSAGNVLYAESTFFDNTQYTLDYCLDEGCYDFVIYDSYGDGICCGFGNGAYSIVLPDSSIAGTGGSFMFSETINFCIYGQGPSPDVYFAGNPIIICEGDQVSFLDQSTNSPTSWQWTFAGGSPSSSTDPNPTVTYNTTGSFDVSLTAANNNGPGTTSISGYITVNDTPAINLTVSHSNGIGGNNGTIIITPTGSGLPYTYQWSNGATTDTINGLAAGMYSVTVTDTNGCSASFTEEVLDVVSIQESHQEVISIHPVPSRDFIWITLNNTMSEPFEIELTELTGRVVYKGWLNNQKSKLDVGELATGVYYLRVICEEKMYVRKLMKE